MLAYFKHFKSDRKRCIIPYKKIYMFGDLKSFRQILGRSVFVRIPESCRSHCSMCP